MSLTDKLNIHYCLYVRTYMYTLYLYWEIVVSRKVWRVSKNPSYERTASTTCADTVVHTCTYARMYVCTYVRTCVVFSSVRI